MKQNKIKVLRWTPDNLYQETLDLFNYLEATSLSYQIDPTKEYVLEIIKDLKRFQIKVSDLYNKHLLNPNIVINYLGAIGEIIQTITNFDSENRIQEEIAELYKKPENNQIGDIFIQQQLKEWNGLKTALENAYKSIEELFEWKN